MAVGGAHGPISYTVYLCADMPGVGMAGPLGLSYTVYLCADMPGVGMAVGGAHGPISYTVYLCADMPGVGMAGPLGLSYTVYLCADMPGVGMAGPMGLYPILCTCVQTCREWVWRGPWASATSRPHLRTPASSRKLKTWKIGDRYKVQQYTGVQARLKKTMKKKKIC